MFTEKMTQQDMKVYKEYLRLVEILTTDEYSGMYEKIGAVQAILHNMEDLLQEEP